MQELKSLSEIFNQKLFRIPDYQRGYAWLIKPQLTDFWEDIIMLGEGKSHYTGVLTLEEVPQNKHSEWFDDHWLIENKGYTPYFVVDGQQRLTTAIILIQAILEIVEELPQEDENDDEFDLNYTPLTDIRKQFIFQKKSRSILRSYIFGYEKDNPSYEFLKTRIFNEPSSTDIKRETLYTLNLENAKRFFKENILVFPKNRLIENIERIFKKVTQHLLFNEYIIKDDVDVYVAFETMNNRGKKLSNLELLKNRLIYLTTLYKEPEEEKITLRNRINDCWKEVYYQLGRSKHNPLNDDDFLRAHWILYFKYSRKQGYAYARFLLDEYFSPKQVLEQVEVKMDIEEIEERRDEITEEDENEFDLEEPLTKLVSKLTIQNIEHYVASLQASARHWYNTYNPINNPELTEEEQVWLDKLNRIGIGYFRPLVLSSLITPKITTQERITLFKAIERFIFLAFRLSQMRSNYGDSEFYLAARDLYFNTISVSDILKKIRNRLAFTSDDEGKFKINNFKNFIDNKFKSYAKDGYYGWRGLRYFLYEYEMHLFRKSKMTNQKIQWSTFVNQKDTVSTEHIYPQHPNDPCWVESFQHFSEEQKNALTNTIGNLLALSQPKNSSLQNNCYVDKRADKEANKGYFNGSYSENRVAEKYSQWTAEEIKDRSFELLQFMEENWNISLGTEEQKLELLHLSFLNEES